MSVESKLKSCCTDYGFTAGLSVCAGAAVGFIANRIYYDYPAAALIGAAVAAITQYRASSGGSLAGRAVVKEDCFAERIRHLVRARSLSQETAALILKTAEESRFPRDFYCSVHDWVQDKKLSKQAAYWVLLSYDLEKGLSTEVTGKLLYDYLHLSQESLGITAFPSTQTLISYAYSFYQTYRGVLQDQILYSVVLKSIYPDSKNKQRIEELLAYQSARARSNGINDKACTQCANIPLKRASDSLRTTTSVAYAKEIPVRSSYRYPSTNIKTENDATTFAVVQAFVAMDPVLSVVLHMFDCSRPEGGPLCSTSNISEGLESVPRSLQGNVMAMERVTFSPVGRQNSPEPFVAQVLSAPVTFSIRLNNLSQTRYQEYMKDVIRSILRAAFHRGNANLLISPFTINPQEVNRFYQEVLDEDEFKNRFDKVVFAPNLKGTVVS